MTEKLAVLIKYDYLKYLDMVQCTDADIGVFMRAVINYDQYGMEPQFENPVLIGFFTFAKFDIDKNRQKWDEVAKVSRGNSKKGGRSLNKETQHNQKNPV